MPRARLQAAIPREDRLRVYRGIFAHSSDAIGVIGPDGRYVEQNEAHRALTGYSDEELRGLTPAVHLGEEGFARVAAALAENGHFRGELESRTKDGRSLVVDLAAFTVRNAAGEVVCHVGIKRDVTEARRQRRELELARAQIAASEKLSALGTLVSGVAHEIRTPLTYIANNLVLAVHALEDVPPEARGRIQARLDEAIAGVDRVNALVKDLRRFTRPQPEEEVVASLDDVVREAFVLFAATHRGEARLSTELRQVPPLRMSKLEVQQLVLNLLQNAADAAGPHGSVRLGTLATPEGGRIVVEDDGPGIPPEVQARMMEPFFTTKPHGTGLGLSIVRRIVRAHEGRLRCVSEPGKGTRFVVDLPRRPGG